MQLYNIIAQKESKLNLEMAGQQRRLAHASKRDSDAMKVISLLGAVFLPGSYLSSLFSMTFFNWQNGSNGPGDDENSPIVAPQLWIYFIITVPLTLAIVLFYRWYDKRREAMYKEEDMDIEAGIEKLESRIMGTMRQRTLSKVKTWDLSKKIG